MATIIKDGSMESVLDAVRVHMERLYADHIRKGRVLTMNGTGVQVLIDNALKAVAEVWITPDVQVGSLVVDDYGYASTK